MWHPSPTDGTQSGCGGLDHLKFRPVLELVSVFLRYFLWLRRLCVAVVTAAGYLESSCLPTIFRDVLPYFVCILRMDLGEGVFLTPFSLL